MIVRLTPAEAARCWLEVKRRIRVLERDGCAPPPELASAEQTLLAVLRNAQRNADRQRELSAARMRRWRARKKAADTISAA